MTIHEAKTIKREYANINYQDLSKAVIQTFKFESEFIGWILKLK